MVLRGKKERIAKAMEEALFHSWWVVLFSLFCLMFYEQGERRQNAFFGELMGKLLELNGEKYKALHDNKELLMQINSQSDPAFIELTLMKVLGVIPDGQVKVYFIEEPLID